MVSISAREGQNLFDISLQYLGSLDGLVELAKMNNLAITDDLKSGQVIVLPDDKRFYNKSVVEYFQIQSIIIVSE